jgi:GDP-4-dehydro-6-deoxy-D-mannose reductase
MKVLVIGAAGFVGNHLIRHIDQDYHWQVIATKLPFESISNSSSVKIVDLDILDIEAITTLIRSENPDYIIHLAAQSSVALSWDNPQLTIDINIKGTMNLLTSIKTLKYPGRLLLIGSGEEYGRVQPNQLPITETTPVQPGNIYAITKITQNHFGKLYADAFGLRIMMVRAFNHIGPGQSPIFVLADFCRQVAQIEKGLQTPEIRVGNLSAKRDFTDVRDVVKAYTSLLLHGKDGELYNVGSGNSYLISDLLQMVLNESLCEIRVTVDPSKFRPIDVPNITASIQKIMIATSWSPSIPMELSIRDTLNYWRNV